MGVEAGDVLPPRRARPVAGGRLAFLVRQVRGLECVEKLVGKAKCGHLPDLEAPPNLLRLPADDQYSQESSLAPDTAPRKHIAMNNDDIIDLHSRIKVGAKVIVLMQGAALYKGV